MIQKPLDHIITDAVKQKPTCPLHLLALPTAHVLARIHTVHTSKAEIELCMRKATSEHLLV